MYYNIDQVAERFSVKPRTVRSWIELGTIPYSKFGKFIRFSEEQVNSFEKTRVKCGESITR